MTPAKRRYLCPVCGSEYHPHDYPSLAIAEESTPGHAFEIGPQLVVQCRGSSQPPSIKWDRAPVWMNKREEPKEAK